ncbi:orotidine 5-phosphate decarboxylase [Sulfitobacter sp. S190]|uniref:orotidine 5-phosphate decarboxylase n=1 Tax=Sulfitobacter sp. S190 TaxID=2867022 RepID=UPI0021A6DF72|nr:orotidine 5-phosphate decarboxylase [Sulfitobacter sp. S190]UWR22154.1 orotidine 5-phosphate decarboxylase [Sulfitobacter sp. S190]
MTNTTVHLGNVVYNAATQSFEAVATVHEGDVTKNYPCAIDAPITMSFEDAARGLKKHALRRHTAGSGLYSQMRRHAPRLRAGRATFDPRTWLAQLGLMSNRDVA